MRRGRYSGIVRMLDLTLSGDTAAAHGMFLVAPDAVRPWSAPDRGAGLS